MNPENMSAKQCCEEILREMNGYTVDSESLRDEIKSLFGKWYKVSNIERRLRESDKVRSVKVKGKNYVKYQWINQH